MPTNNQSLLSLNNCVGVWTLSIVFRAEDDHTSAAAYLEGPDIEIEATGASPRAVGDHDVLSAYADLAAAEVLTHVSHRLAQRALRQVGEADVSNRG
jgi:hypothetical protein